MRSKGSRLGFLVQTPRILDPNEYKLFQSILKIKEARFLQKVSAKTSVMQAQNRLTSLVSKTSLFLLLLASYVAETRTP